jgi:hypothetical protein
VRKYRARDTHTLDGNVLYTLFEINVDILIRSILFCLQQIASFFHLLLPRENPPPPTTKRVLGTLSPEVKRPKREPDHSLPSSTRLRTSGAIPAFPRITSF